MGSFLEAFINIASGFLVAWLTWTFVIIPVFSFPFEIWESLEITVIFTFLSFARTYAWRRIFNWHQGRR